jgi:hypothetical protein
MYELFGLRIRSEIPFPASPVGGDGFDVDLRWGEPRPVPPVAPAGERLAGLAVADRTFHTAVRDGDGVLFRFCEVCEVRISPTLDSVVVYPDPHGPVDMVPIFLAGNVMALLLTLRGLEVLHGSAVAMGGSAVAFVGHSNAGKSTLAGEACAAGASLVADDVLAVEIGDDGAHCVRGGPELRLRKGVTELAERLAPGADRTVDGRAAVAVVTSPVRCELAAIVVPQVTPGAPEPRLVPLGAKAAFKTLFPYHRLAGLTDPVAVRRHFHACVDLARIVPVLSLVVAPGYAGPAATLSLSLCDQGDRIS